MEHQIHNNFVLIYNKFNTTGTEIVKEYLSSFGSLEERIGTLYSEERVGFIYSGQVLREVEIHGNNLILKQNV